MGWRDSSTARFDHLKRRGGLKTAETNFLERIYGSSVWRESRRSGVVWWRCVTASIKTASVCAFLLLFYVFFLSLENITEIQK